MSQFPCLVMAMVMAAASRMLFLQTKEVTEDQRERIRQLREEVGEDLPMEDWPKDSLAAERIIRGLRGTKKRQEALRRWEVQVHYKTSAIRQLVERTPGFLDFVLYHIRQLVVINERRVRDLPFEERTTALAAHQFSEIILTDTIVNMWRIDEANTRKYLPFVLAHEYRHHLFAAKSLKIPSGIPKRDRRLYLERVADEFAEEYTGISANEAAQGVRNLEEKLLRVKSQG